MGDRRPERLGESTLTASVRRAHAFNVIDPDAIARELDPGRPERAAIQAARESIGRCQRLLALRESFAIETTLAGNGPVATMRRAKEAGYRVSLLYVALDQPGLNVERVQLRVEQGGHDVPVVDILRRIRGVWLRRLKPSDWPIVRCLWTTAFG